MLSELKQDIESWTLVPSSGGVHEVEIDGEIVHSKKETGRHPTPGEIIEAIRARLG